MAYNYEEIKPKLFIEAHQRLFLEIRDTVHRHLSEAGIAKMGFILNGISGDSWVMMACVDRLVELGEIQEVFHGDCSGQDRIFIKKEET